jgi:hypothetical protein
MANLIRPQMLKGQFSNRPHLFISSDYDYWKTRMTIYIKALDYRVWRVIANGPQVPIKNVSGEKVPKEESEWDEIDLKLIYLYNI